MYVGLCHGAVDRSHATEAVRLHYGGGIRSRVAGVLDADLQPGSLAHGVDGSPEHEQK